DYYCVIWHNFAYWVF
nr:immunoglobulin light chain junction region [Macaca mulatta]MOX82200.1 immunoglobulin light chain junction region [Macaca mulatta]MOX83235.1 immunoglobulin light chain junction region [Macaca mulatta]MOX83430.1 immunoglobulin light chain junction region [Macaca mulatta]